MSKIRIRNFGPIKEGYLENDGWIDIAKVTVFIGNQGSGKSTVAKAISVMTWLEKALVRKDFEAPQRLADIEKFFDYQNLKNYFRNDTTIEYQGDAYRIDYIPNSTELRTQNNENAESYKLPKIMYVPAERNFLSVVKNAFDVKGLPETLFTFGEELRRTQDELNDEILPLPINDFQYQYNKADDISYVVGEGYKISLNESSSGLQSTIPLYIVSKNIAENIADSSMLGETLLSIRQINRMTKEIQEILRDSVISIEEKMINIEEIENRFHNRTFINIVEEPEQNLFPSSQKKILESLLQFNNMTDGNKLIMTTHSPYIINYLSIAIQAKYLENKIETSSNKESLQSKLYNLVPKESLIAANEVVVYQLDEKDGGIKKLATIDGIPSDKNYLNKILEESNLLFDALLEIEQEL